MAKIQRANGGPVAENYSVGLNIVLTGSKSRAFEENEKIISASAVRVLIVDADDEHRVLVDEIAQAKEFTTGSVGFGLNLKVPGFQIHQQ